MDAKSKMIFCCIVWISLEYLQQPEALHQAFFSKELVANFQESVAIYFLIFIISHLEWGSSLLLNEGIPRALKGKKLRLKIPRLLPSIFELFLVFQIWGQNTIGGQYMQNIDALIFWYKYLQKVNAMPSDFWWKKKQVLLHWWIFF